MKTPVAQQGFTLVELMTALAVVAIALTAGAPSFREMIQDNRMSGYVNEFVTDLNLARSEAVKRAGRVVLCKRNTTGTDCDSSAAWVNGWLVFVDTNGDSAVNSGEEILRVHEALTGLGSINYTRNGIAYGSDGLLTGFSGLLSNGTLTFCDSRGISKAKGRVLSPTGRLRASISTDTLACS
jgi:type IV fimbrial biogenesis protein FimT